MGPCFSSRQSPWCGPLHHWLVDTSPRSIDNGWWSGIITRTVRYLIQAVDESCAGDDRKKSKQRLVPFDARSITSLRSSAAQCYDAIVSDRRVAANCRKARQCSQIITSPRPHDFVVVTQKEQDYLLLFETPRHSSYCEHFFNALCRKNLQPSIRYH